MRSIFRRLFRVYAHVYYYHYERVQQNNYESHLNTCFKHFVLFVLEHRLMPRAELKPLEALIEWMCPDAWSGHLRREAGRRWGRVRRLAAAVGGFSSLLLGVYEEVHYRPGNEGARFAFEHFTTVLDLADAANDDTCQVCLDATN